MNEHRKEEKQYCHFHPKEETIGVCHLCLNERLLILVADQTAGSLRPEFPLINKHKKPPPMTPPNKIFALGPLIHRFEFPHKGEESLDCQSDASAASLEDSFISIKFEDNGVATWEKSKVSLDHCRIGWNQNLSKETNRSVVERAKPLNSLRWRKQIGHLFQLSRLRKCSSHVGRKLEGVKVRSGWIRALTKRKTIE